jgi:hypothetical protein
MHLLGMLVNVPFVFIHMAQRDKITLRPHQNYFNVLILLSLCSMNNKRSARYYDQTVLSQWQDYYLPPVNPVGRTFMY